MSQAAMILWLHSELKAMPDLPRNVHNCTAMLDLPAAAGEGWFYKMAFYVAVVQCYNCFYWKPNKDSK